MCVCVFIFYNIQHCTRVREYLGWKRPSRVCVCVLLLLLCPIHVRLGLLFISVPRPVVDALIDLEGAVCPIVLSPPPPHTHTKSWLLYTNFPPSFPFPPKTLLFLMAWLLDPASSSSNSHTSHDSVVSDHLKGLIRLDAHFFTQYKCMGCPAQYSQGGCRLAAQWSGGKDVSTRLGSVAALIYRFYFPWILL